MARLIAVMVALAATAPPVRAQQARPPAAGAPAVLHRLEAELWARITERARRANGFHPDSGELDLRIPLRGEPEVIVGPTTHAAGAVAVGSARMEALDAVTPLERVARVRYDLRLEDRVGNCVAVHQEASLVDDTLLVRGVRMTEPCRPLYMAEVVRRNRRIARLPLDAGRLSDRWSVALAANALVDVYEDSLVITTTALALRASSPKPYTAAIQVDSITVGLALGDRSWNVVRHSAPLPVDTAIRQDGEWRRTSARFTIAIDSTFDLQSSWPVFEVHLKVPETEVNPRGIAWTYAHGPKGFFAEVRWPRRP